MNFIVLLDLLPCKKNFRIIGKKERDVEKISMKKGNDGVNPSLEISTVESNSRR